MNTKALSKVDFMHRFFNDLTISVLVIFLCVCGLVGAWAMRSQQLNKQSQFTKEYCEQMAVKTQMSIKFNNDRCELTVDGQTFTVNNQ